MFLKKKVSGPSRLQDVQTLDRRENTRQSREELTFSIIREAIMMSCTIDSNEVRYLVLTYIPGAFLHVDMNETLKER